MSQILEHVVDPRAWVEKAARLLSARGGLAVALPNFDSFVRLVLGTGDPMIQPPDHLNYFNREGLIRLICGARFTVTAIDFVSRLPGSAFTDRVPLPGCLERPVERLLQTLQRPFLWPLDALGLGMFLNVYAVKEFES